jgi:4-hydroxyphenylpyruvate dioxygenase
VRRGEFLSWSLFYDAVLGLEPQPQVEVADPHGAFFSRLLRSPNGELRIALNIGEGGATGVSRFIDAFGGAGFQQIALSSNDIFAAGEAARASGVALLPIPDNYYDDLSTRFDIAPELLARMRALEVLYDRMMDGVPYLYSNLPESLFLRDHRAAQLRFVRRRQHPRPASRPGLCH